MIGYKGFDQNFRCRDFQYEVGKTYRHDNELDIRVNGFHFCDTPLSVFKYYSPAGSRFALVEATGKIISTGGHKFCTDKITILKELSLDEFIANVGSEDKIDSESAYSAATNTGAYSAATNTGVYSTVTNTGAYSAATNTGAYSAATNTGVYSAATNTGDYSAATNTGDYSAATNTGDYSTAINTGNYSAAKVFGKNSIAVATGWEGKAMGALGCWLVLTEWSALDAISDVQVVNVDGVNIKPDTFYQLFNGKVIEVEVTS